MPESVIIAGAGLAGLQVAASLRELGFDGRVVIVGDETHAPYHRPPLSKNYLMGTTEEAKLSMRPAAYYVEKKLELHVGRRVVALDRAHHHVALDDDTVIDYGHFVFAVGARNRPLPVNGAELGNVFYLRTLAEARDLKAALARAKHAVVIGAGFIGLEFAATARQQGVEVTVLEVADRPMARAVSPEMSAIFTREHRSHGIRFLFNTQVLHLLGEQGVVTGIETVAREHIAADLVVIGIGVQPNVEVAAAAGLTVENGIVVDEQLSTSDASVSAIGDCAAFPSRFADGARVRLESVQNATDQARCVAARLLGRPASYDAVPWFWSDQGNLKLQIAGLTSGATERVLRGDPAGTSCAVFYFRGDALLGVETVNRVAEHMLARRIVGQRIALTPAEAADESYDLKAHVARATAGH